MTLDLPSGPSVMPHIQPDDGFSRYFAPHSLDSEDCLNFSFDSIKDLVEVLEQSAPDNDLNFCLL